MSVPAAEPAPTQTISAMPPEHVRRLVLTGFMGAGKTTVGRLLAERLGWNFLDLDASIEARTGLPVPAIFAAHGEPHFRRLESLALATALGQRNLVLALGGGALESLTNRLLLEQTPATLTFFLDAPFPVLYDRCMMQALGAGASTDPGQSRPNLADPVAAQARFHARQPIYRRHAHHTVSTADLTTAQTAAAVLTHLHQPPPRRR